MPKLTSYVHVDGVAYGPDSDVPADVAKQITNPKAWEGGEVADSSDDEGEAKSYADMSAAELEAAAAKRDLDVKGTGANGNVVKADLIAALTANDDN